MNIQSAHKTEQHSAQKVPARHGLNEVGSGASRGLPSYDDIFDLPPMSGMLLAAFLLLSGAVAEPSTTIYVSSARGDDDNDGTNSNSPLRTFGAARDRARELDAGTVQFEAGTYPVSGTLALDARDSGRSDSPRMFKAAPGSEGQVDITADIAVTGWRHVVKGDAAWPSLTSEAARSSVMVAPLPPTAVPTDNPNMLFDARAEAATPSDRAVRKLPDTNVVYSLVPDPKQDSEMCDYLGQFDDESGCRAAALARDGLWAYAWHDPAQISGDFASGCYARRYEHGSRKFTSQQGVMSGVFAPSLAWREVTDWEISSSVLTQHRCPGAECEYFDPAKNKSTIRVALEGLDQAVGNAASSLSLRIYLVDFAMNVLPVESISSRGELKTAYPGTLLLGQKPGYCEQDYDEGKCSPAIWLLNTMNFTMPGQFAINSQEGNVYYWPALASGDVSGVSIPATTTLLSLKPTKGQNETVVKHIEFSGLTFAHADRARLPETPDAGGIQHNWARLQSRNALVTMSGVLNITWSSCMFKNSGGGGLRVDGAAKGVVVTNSTFTRLGYEAMGFYGLGLGLDQVTSDNAFAANDVSHTALVKFDSPAIVIWGATYTSVLDNYIHDTSSRALYIGGSRYCTKPSGFATDGGIYMNSWDDLDDANIPASWVKTCEDASYAYTFAADCKCSYFRGVHGSVVSRNTFARVTQHKDRPFFSDGLVYVSGPGYVEDEDRDITVFQDNVYLVSPGVGAPSFRMLYVDGYTGSMRISRNAVVNGNAHQGFMLCNWYGHSTVESNALQLGDASWGSDYEISVNCDGNPVLTTRGNLVLSDESSPSHQPDAELADEYAKVYRMVCAASIRAGVKGKAGTFLDALNRVLTSVGKDKQVCE